MNLPLFCETEYIRSFLDKVESDQLFKYLMGFRNLTRMFELKLPTGKKIEYDFGKMMFVSKYITDQKENSISSHGDAIIWTTEMLAIKERVENYAGHKFDVCVCIFYPNGKSGVDYHSDFPAFGDTSIIPSISLGEERIFRLREKESQKVYETTLHNGSMLVMGENCQERYEHSLPEDPRYKSPRINLTFRKYGFS